MGRKRKRPQGDQHVNHDLEAPKVKGAHLYTRQGELPWDLQPNWKHRHSLFSLYDDGIWMTEDSWFEVTPEPLATSIANHVGAARPSNGIIMIDCFAGIGGNAIAFARSGKYKRVYAIEKNMVALECAQHNAKIYGVQNQITFFHGDCFELLGLDDGRSGKKVDSLVEVIKKAGIIFASPPWGGVGYKDTEIMDLNNMPYSLNYMYSRFSTITKNQVLYLPRTSDLNQIADCVQASGKTQVVHYCIYENSKAMCVYFGDWQDITV